MHTAGPICVSCFIVCDVPCIVSAVYAMVMSEFSPVVCYSVSFEKGIMKLTLGVYCSHPRVGVVGKDQGLQH